MRGWLGPAVAILAVVVGVVLVAGADGDDDTRATGALGSAAAEADGGPVDGAAGEGGTTVTMSDGGTTVPVSDGRTGPVISGPSTSGSTTTIGSTVDTVEADETTPDSTDGDSGTDGGEPDDTVPTVPEPTSGTCALTVADLNGRSGPIEPSTGGACDAVGLTIQAVNPRDDLTALDWGREIRVCQRHPAASAIGVEVASAAGTTDLADGLSRSPDEAAADPLRSITIRFDDQAAPLTGPRPIASCRTAEAELSIVHRPTP